MWAVKLDGEVYATFETPDEAYGFVGAYLGQTQQTVEVVEWEPEE